jgi:Uncharacterized protein conserved in bacteria (DUF2125)
MPRTIEDRALAALMAAESEEPMSAAAENAPPKLAERVEMYLRAIHGGGRPFTVEESAAARERILDAMAANLLDEGTPDPEQVAGLSAVAAVRPTAQRETAGSLPYAILEQLTSIIETLLFDLQAPFTSPLAPLRIAAALLIAALALGGIWSGTWFYQARSGEDRLASWIETEATSGRVHECASRKIEGYPLEVKIRCLEPRTLVKVGETTYVLKAAEIVAATSLFPQSSLTTEIIGPLTIAELGHPDAFVANWTSAKTAARDQTGRVSLAITDFSFDQVAAGGGAIANADKVEIDVRFGSRQGGGVIDIARARALQQQDVAIARGEIEFGAQGLAATLQVTSTVAGWQRFVQSFDNSDPRRNELAQAVTQLEQMQFAERGRNELKETDSGTPLEIEPAFQGKRTVDVPVQITDGNLSIGGTLIRKLRAGF